jgi:hypothetical protein
MPRDRPQLNEHPTRLCQRAQLIAIERKDDPVIAEPAAIVAALCHHVEQAKVAANRNRTLPGRIR